jgi:hypothetical protein
MRPRLPVNLRSSEVPNTLDTIAGKIVGFRRPISRRRTRYVRRRRRKFITRAVRGTIVG